MKQTNIIHSLCLIALLFSCGDAKKERLISIGEVDSLRSEILGENRKIWIYHPGNPSDTSRHYPVLYLLDGDAHFHSVTGIAQQLTNNSVMPEMIIVAVLNTDRSRDLTPTRSLRLPTGGEQDFLKTTGGAENFTQFLDRELIPYIEGRFATAPHRMLIGHSFGGLFAINTLLNHPEMFNSYLAIDPSMWWDDRKLLLQSDSIFGTRRFDGKTLFVSVANTMSPGMDTTLVALDTTGNTVHIRSILDFAKKAATASSSNGLTFAWKYYRDDDHGSVPLISEYDALRFMFQHYKLPFSDDLTTAKLIDHYTRVSDRLGYTMIPPEERMNGLGYYFLQTKNYERAFEFFDFNVKNYPNSQNVYDSMGDYYAAIKDNAKAIEAYEKALSFGEVEYTRKKLQDLENDQLAP